MHKLNYDMIMYHQWQISEGELKFLILDWVDLINPGKIHFDWIKNDKKKFTDAQNVHKTTKNKMWKAEISHWKWK